ncbi:MAG: hypothetical protein VB081_06545 [Christensenella sp.]|uniref:hypothetical protein n=1 Tax=Christensenella sp. TaxID=1935934 RepID=UPI002B1FDBDD|nr:hypothetical protein [Christensenella sp.]MEA5003141.1 hypothetical protein [Christensenella sp.]
MTEQEIKKQEDELGVAYPDMPPEDWRKAFMRRMEGMEALLVEQREHNKKALRSSRTHTVIMLVFVVVFAVGLFVMNATLQSATKDLPAMFQAVTQLTETATKDLDETIAQINALDFGALNDTIKGIAEIPFDALGESIAALQAIIKPLASVMGAFG